MKIKQKGFTLIELLVVIAIIGLLSTMAVVSLNSARAKARDAKRLNDVKQMANILSIEATEGTGNENLVGCTAINSDVILCTGKLVDGATVAGEIKQFSKFKDPSSDTPCVAGATATCQYSITADGATVNNAVIRFYLENASGGLIAGAHTINSSGVFDPI